MQLLALRELWRNQYDLGLHFFVSGTSRTLTTQKGTCMKSAIVMKVAAAAVVIGLAGCQDLKPLESSVHDLQSAVAKLQTDVSAAKA